MELNRFEQYFTGQGAIPYTDTPVPSAKIGDRLAQVDADQRMIRGNNRRRWEDEFSRRINTLCERWSVEYCSLAQQPYNPRLTELLRTLRLQGNIIALTDYTAAKKRILPLSALNVRERLEHFEIPYDEDAAAQLMENVGALFLWLFSNSWPQIIAECQNTVARKLEQTRQLRDKSFANEEKWLNENQRMRCLNNLASCLQELPHMLGSYEYFDGHLILHRALPPRCDSGVQVVENYSKVLKLPAPQCKRIFNSLCDAQKTYDGICGTKDGELLHTIERKGFLGLFTDGLGRMCGISYDSNRGELIAEKLRGLPRHSVKLIHTNYGLEAPPDEIRSLALITGRNVEASDRMAKLFADIADIRKGQNRCTVLFTKQNAEALRAFISKVFDCGDAGPVAEEKESSLKSLLSVNNLFTEQGLRQLLSWNIEGRALVLIGDRLPTDHYATQYYLMAKGKKLEVRSKVFKTQSFHNRLHLVCVTGNRAAAKKYAEQFHAEIVDLSQCESKCPLEEITAITARELDWLRTSFLLHGFRIKSEGKLPKAAFQGTDAKDFLHDCCVFSAKGVCERGELYEAYRAYYRKKHLCETPESSISFVKRIRKQMPSSVIYKVKRHGTDNKTHMCFLGIKLREDIGASCPQDDFTHYQSAVSQEAQRILGPYLNTARGLKVVASVP